MARNTSWGTTVQRPSRLGSLVLCAAMGLCWAPSAAAAGSEAEQTALVRRHDQRAALVVTTLGLGASFVCMFPWLLGWAYRTDPTFPIIPAWRYVAGPGETPTRTAVSAALITTGVFFVMIAATTVVVGQMMLANAVLLWVHIPICRAR